MKKFLELDFYTACHLLERYKHMRYLDSGRDDDNPKQKLFNQLNNPIMYLDLLDEELNIENVIHFAHAGSFFFAADQPDFDDIRFKSFKYINLLYNSEKDLSILKDVKDFVNNGESDYFCNIFSNVDHPQTMLNNNVPLLLYGGAYKNIKTNKAAFIGGLNAVINFDFKGYSKIKCVETAIYNLITLSYLKHQVYPNNKILEEYLSKAEKHFIHYCKEYRNLTSYYLSALQGYNYSDSRLRFLKKAIPSVIHLYENNKDYKVLLRSLKTYMLEIGV